MARAVRTLLRNSIALLVSNVTTVTYNLLTRRGTQIASLQGIADTDVQQWPEQS